jgi:predicted O-methyltransferase YrrM
MPTFAPSHSRLDQARELVASLVARGGPAEVDYPHFTALMNQLPECSPEEVDALRAILGDAVTHPDTMQGHAYTKPHGYAGDFEIIDRIYRQHVTQEPHLAAWDRYFHAQPATRAVRNRKSYFHALLDQHAARVRPLRVLNLASGPGRCMAEWLAAHPEADVQFTCVELDAAAIAHARSLLGAASDRVTFVRENILRYTTTGRFDLIWAAGVCDYFSDAIFARMLRRYLPLVAPGGELVAGNFSDANPNRHYMEILGDWRLHHRPAETLRRIASVAGAPPDSVTIGAEPEGVNLFLHLAAPGRGAATPLAAARD